MASQNEGHQFQDYPVESVPPVVLFLWISSPAEGEVSVKQNAPWLHSDGGGVSQGLVNQKDSGHLKTRPTG